MSKFNELNVKFIITTTLLIIAISLLSWNLFEEKNSKNFLTLKVSQALAINSSCELNKILIEDTAQLDNLVLKILYLENMDVGRARELARLILLTASKTGEDPDLLLAVIDKESNFNPYALSTTGAIGYMQVMPFWLKQLNLSRSLWDIETNLMAGATILKHYRNRYKNHEDKDMLALSAYNRGEKSIDIALKSNTFLYNSYARDVMIVQTKLKELTLLEDLNVEHMGSITTMAQD